MFTIYSMEGCGYCDQVVQLMQLTSQSFVNYKLDRDFTIEEFKDEFGTSTFPMVTRKDKVIGGAAETAAYFKENGLA